MNLEDQVTNLQLSKKLKELNVKQESIFYWLERLDMDDFFHKSKVVFAPNVFHDNAVTLRDYCSAFTASELMELLPDKIVLPLKYQPFDCYRFILERSFIVEDDGKIIPTFIVNYMCDTYDPMKFAPGRLFKNIWDKSLCNALAKMLIHQHETKLSEILETK